MQTQEHILLFTSIGKQCPLPSDIPNGKVLTKKEHILYEDKVDYECNHGFITSDSTTLKCEWNGQYSSNPPVCSGKLMDNIPVIPQSALVSSWTVFQ